MPTKVTRLPGADCKWLPRPAQVNPVSLSYAERIEEDGSDEANSIRPREIYKDDDRGIADRHVMAGEGQAACLAVHAEDREVVTSLIAGVQEPAGGVEIEAARIVPACPLLQPGTDLR